MVIMTKCWLCGRKFRDGEIVIEVQQYVVNERHGDFVTTTPNRYAHASHLTRTEWSR